MIVVSNSGDKIPAKVHIYFHSFEFCSAFHSEYIEMLCSSSENLNETLNFAKSSELLNGKASTNLGAIHLLISAVCKTLSMIMIPLALDVSNW